MNLYHRYTVDILSSIFQSNYLVYSKAFIGTMYKHYSVEDTQEEKDLTFLYT
jgi:hypothetical protein